MGIQEGGTKQDTKQGEYPQPVASREGGGRGINTVQILQHNGKRNSVQLHGSRNKYSSRRRGVFPRTLL